MTVVVSFVRPKNLYSASGIGSVRVRENLAVGGTTSATAEDGEMIVVGNGETSMVAVAFGSGSPDAANTGFALGAGQVSLPIVANAGDKVNVKTVT